jgi:ubiquinone/menaquinone biosynthesis C-methylase UbiE
VATDASAEQIAAAGPAPKIEFRPALAEDSGLAADSVDLITVAQALHWFDMPAFFAETQRVLRSGGLLAIWCYAHHQVNKDCDRVISRMFAQVEDHWPAERAIVENHYRDIAMPFAELPVPEFSMSVMWKADDILAYFRTWSASQRYMRERKADPVATIAAELKDAWGAESREVRWPLILRLSRK